MQANIGDQRTIAFIAGVAHFSGIVTIWSPVTTGRLEDTPLGAIGTGPTVRVLNCWVLDVTLPIAEGVSHVCAVFTQGLCLGAACLAPSSTTAIVTFKDWPAFIPF